VSPKGREGQRLTARPAVWPAMLNVDDINPLACSGLRTLKSWITWSPEPRDYEFPAPCALSFISDVPSRTRYAFPIIFRLHFIPRDCDIPLLPFLTRVSRRVRLIASSLAFSRPTEEYSSVDGHPSSDIRELAPPLSGWDFHFLGDARSHVSGAPEIARMQSAV